MFLRAFVQPSALLVWLVLSSAKYKQVNATSSLMMEKSLNHSALDASLFDIIADKSPEERGSSGTNAIAASSTSSSSSLELTAPSLILRDSPTPAASSGRKLRESANLATCLASKAVGLDPPNADQLGRGMCTVPEDAEGVRADFIRFMQNDYFPLVALLESFGCDFVNDAVGASQSSCVRPCQLLMELIDLAMKPCEEVIEKAKKVHKALKVFDKVLDRAKKLPYIKIVAKKMKPALDPIKNFFKALSTADNGKCKRMREKADKTERDLFQKMNEAVEHFRKFNKKAAVSVELLCIQEHFETELETGGLGRRLTGGRARALQHMQVLTNHRLGNDSSNNATMFHLSGRDRSRRFLKFNQETLDFSALRSATEVMTDALSSILGFGEHVEGVRDAVKPVLDTFLTGLDFVNSLKGVFDFFDAFEPIMNVLSKIVDSLKFLKCPGVLGPICDLDSIAVSIVEKLLSAVGINVDEIISDLIEGVMEKLGFPDVLDIEVAFPDLDFVDINVDLELFDNLKTIVGDILGLVKDDPLPSAYDSSGTPDFSVPTSDGRIIDFEFRFAKGSLEAISTIQCPSGLIPLTLAATASTACGVEDFTGKAEIPCRGDSCNSVNLKPLLDHVKSRCSNIDEKLAAQGFGFEPDMMDESTFLYTCIDGNDLGLIKPMPPLNIVDWGAGEPLPLTCTDGIVEPLGLSLQEVERHECDHFIKPWHLQTDECIGTNTDDQCQVIDDDSNACAYDGFNYAANTRNCLHAPMKSKRRHWNGCDTDDESKYASFASFYTCKQPERDCGTVNQKIDFYLGRGRRSDWLFYENTGCKCITTRRDHCASEQNIRVKSFYRPGEFKLGECPAHLPNQVLIEVLQSVNNEVEDVTARWKKKCKDKDIEDCAEHFQGTCGGGNVGNGICANNACCSRWGWCSNGDAWCNDLAEPGPQPEAMYRFTTECLCPDGHSIHADPDTGFCTPCGAGMFRQGDAASCQDCPLGHYSSVEDAASCQVCPAGTFSDQTGSSACKSCPAGTYAPDTGNESIESCIPCSDGTYSSSGASSCEACPDGEEECRFQAEPGQFMLEGVLYDCPAGTFLEAYNQTEWEESGRTECEPCPPGSYAPTSRSKQCLFCPFGTWSSEPGSTECNVCGGNTYHTEYGATDASQCVGFSRIDYRVPEFSELTCEELLALDLDDTDVNANQAIVQTRMNQIGNGMCNKGPWNTEQCGYDGGDCCPQTCQIPEIAPADDQYEAELACTPTTFDCDDPAHIPPTPAPTTLPPSPPTPPCNVGCGGIVLRPPPAPSPDLVQATAYETCLGDFVPDRSGIPTPEENVGDGVCDPLLNTADHDYDGGDCCLATCQPNPRFPESCLSNCQCVDPEGDW